MKQLKKSGRQFWWQNRTKEATQFDSAEESWQPSQEFLHGDFDLGRELLGPNILAVNLRTNQNLGAKHFDWDLNYPAKIVALPFTRFSSTNDRNLVVASKFYEDIYHTFGLQRLNSIRQLIYLAKTDYNRYFQHTRYLHVLTTAIMMEIWMRLNNYLEDEINFWVCAAYLHDAATPVFGDMLKYFRPEEYDENTNFAYYLNLLDQEQLNLFLEKYNIDRDRLIKAVTNTKSFPMGRVLKIVDKINYTVNDLYAFYIEGGPNDEQIYPECHLYESLVTFLDKINHKPYFYFGDCFIDLRLDDSGIPFFIYSENLMFFLIARSYLARDFYFNPESRANEILIGKYLEDNFLSCEIVSKDELLLSEEYMIIELLKQRLDENNPRVKKLESMLYPYQITDWTKHIDYRVGTRPRRKVIHTQEIKFDPMLDLAVNYYGKKLAVYQLDDPIVDLLGQCQEVIQQPIYYYLK